jgi:NAD(P)-dependent dehydrogenase (short-subunit alcohol dehydrogenase family)
VPADVRDQHQARAAVETVVDRWARIDVLVNDAGVIVSAPFDETTDDDFRELLDVHFWGTLHMSRAALPYLRRRAGARLVTVASIAGKIGVPHLSAYCASKFAQAGLSAAMAAELRSAGVRVITVFPGFIRTGSHINAQFKGRLRKEFATFALAGTLPGLSMGGERAARTIVAAIERGRAEVVLPLIVRQIARAAALAPQAAYRAMTMAARLLPKGNPRDAGLSRVRGQDIGLPAGVRALTTLGERAADRNNQRQARRID